MTRVKVQYCVLCHEAVEYEQVIDKITNFASYQIKWTYSRYAVCVNEKCVRYALLSNRVAKDEKKEK